jgi:hypothetical protein
MYVPMIVVLTFILPLVSILAQLLLGTHAAPHASDLMPAIAKWYVFWALGVRLLLAGLRQTLQPAYTARTILGIEGTECLVLVREVGFANLALGSIATASLYLPGWVIPAALAGGIYYGLAGINHIFRKHRSRLETVAMTSDLFAGYVLISCCVSAALSTASPTN